MKNSLVCFEDHTLVHLEIVVDIEPCSIGAWLSFDAIVEHPFILLLLVFTSIILHLHVALYFGQQLIIDLYVTIWCPPYEYISCAFLHLAHVIFVDLAVVSTTEDLEAQSVVELFFINSFWEKVDHDVCFTHVNEHVVLENDAACYVGAVVLMYGIHLLEDTEADAQVFDVVPLLSRLIAPSLRLWIKENLKVLPSVLLRRLLISTWNHKIVHDYRALPSLILVVMTRHQIFVVVLDNIGQRSEVSASIWCIIPIVLKLTK